MATHILPASPSWYCSRAIDCDDRSILCFGAKNTIYVFDVSDKVPAFAGQISAHADRVVGLSLSPDRDVLKCASAGEDGKVKLWSLNDKTLLKEHSFHVNKPTTIHCSPCNSDVIVSGDDKGRIIVYNPSSGEHKSMTFEQQHIFSLTCSPLNQHLAAIGYKTGLILVVDVGRKGEVVQRLRGHDEEIHSLVWCPSPSETAELLNKGKDELRSEDADDGGYLASGCRDRTIRVWSLSRGKSALLLKLPYNTGHRRDRFDEAKTRVWLTLYWPKQRPGELVSSSFNGDLLLWDMAKDGKQKWQVFSQGLAAKGHQRIIFNICCGGKENNSLITTSMDRQINLWNLEDVSGDYCMSSIGGFAYAVSVSPVHPGRMAIGCGDNLLRVWNLENPNDPLEVQTFWQGIKSKVTAICWHPEREGLLAYGTDDGRVGVYDVLSNKAPNISSTYHKRTVYVVQWGPHCAKKGNSVQESGYNLYSCGDGAILQHFSGRFENDAQNINSIIQDTNNVKCTISRSEICWKQDFSAVAIGNDDGSIEIYKPPHLFLQCRVLVHKKLVNCIAWHPLYTAEGSEESACSSWIASGSNESSVYVTNLSQALSKTEDDKAMVITESFCQLDGHTNRITGLSWSVHQEGLLASASFDWSAQVWDVKAGSPLANFRGHRGKVMCVQWSHLEAGVVYSGADDHTVQKWKYADQPDTLPLIPTKKRVRKNKKSAPRPREEDKDPPDVITHTSGEVNKETSVEELQRLLQLKKQELEAQLTADSQQSSSDVKHEAEAQNESITDDATKADDSTKQKQPVGISSMESSVEVADDTLDVEEEEEEGIPTNVFTKVQRPEQPTYKKDDRKDRKKKKWKSLFPLSSSLDNRGKATTQQDCVNLAKIIYPDAEGPATVLDSDSWHLGGFLDRRAMYEFHGKEGEYHTAGGNWEQLLTLAMFRGNPKELILQAKEAGTLNDWLLALAPSVSTQFWRDMCVSYAQQLEKDGNLQKSAGYLLSAQKVYEAIDMLKNNHMFKEAVGLAKVRLSPHDPVIAGLYQTWASQLTRDGNLEMAAKCYLALKDPIEAAKVLTKRADQSALTSAIDILITAGETETAQMYGQKLIQRCIQASDWSAAAKTVLSNPCFKVYSLIVSTHQALVTQLDSMGLISKDITESATLISEEASRKTGEALPLILYEADPSVDKLWTAHTVEGEAFIHYILRQWHDVWDVGFTLPDINIMYQQLTAIKQTQQAQSGHRQVLSSVSIDIALGLLKFILSDTEEAARWWTSACASAQDAGCTDIMQGIVRLLLPSGPDDLLKLQQQTRASRILLTKDSPTSLSRNERKVSAVGISHLCSSIDRTTGAISNSSECCSNIDSLFAYYWLSTLDCLCDKTPEKSTSQEVAGLSKEYLESMCRGLIWDVQARRYKLTESLQYISKATVKLVAAHKAASFQSLDKPSESVMEMLKPAPVKERPGSGEYITMYGSELGQPQPVLLHGQKPHQRIPPSPCKPPVGEMVTGTITEERTLGAGSGPDANTTSQDSQGQCTTPPIQDVNGAESEAVDVAAVPVLTPLQLVSEPGVNKEVEEITRDLGKTTLTAEKEEMSHELPTGWESMSVDEKYLHPALTLVLLSRERDKVTEQYKSLPESVKASPFPNPLTSAIKIRSLLCDMDPTSFDMNSLQEWIISHAYLKVQQD